MSLVRRAAALAGVGGILFTAAAAFAAPPPAVYKTAAGEIVLHSGLTATQQVLVEYPNIPAARKIKADYCGLVTVPTSDSQPIGSTVTVDGTQLTVSSLPVQTKPACSNNTLAESRTANFKLTNGSVVVVGKTPGITSTVLFDGANTKRSLRANGCGFLVVRPSDSLPIGSSLVFNSTSYTLSSLSTDSMPLCRTENGSAVRYNPATW